MSAFAEGHRIGPYRIVRLLGEGGMGAVYEARHEPLDRRVALKTLHPQYADNQDAVARFFNEAKILSRLEHPSIVQVSDFGKAPDGTAYLVMEHLRGQSLGSRLAAQNGRLSVVAALQLAWQVADVLAIAHRQQIVHRDLKPENLMLVSDPVAPGGERVKILDFGIAKLIRESDRGSVKTHAQAVMGTPMYMSPEQCAGAGGVDAKSDVYSLGCVLYQMLGGRPPFEGSGAGQLIGQHLYQEPTPLSTLAPKVSPDIIELVHRLLIKDKQLRPSMAEAAEALGRLLVKLSGVDLVARQLDVADIDLDSTHHLAALRPPKPPALRRGPPRSPAVQWQILLAAAFMGVLLVLVIAARYGKKPAPPRPSARSVIAATPVITEVAPPSATPPPPPDAAVAPPQVHWQVNTEPQGATLLDENGAALGKTPWADEHPARTGTRKLRLQQEGFSVETLELDEAADAAKTITLKKILPPRQLATSSPSGRPPVLTDGAPQLTAARKAMMEGSHKEAIKLAEPYCTPYAEHKLLACRLAIVSLCTRKAPGDEAKAQKLFLLLDQTTRARVRQQCVATGIDPLKARID